MCSCRPKDSTAGRQHLEQAVEERRGAESSPEFQAIRRGWCLGGESFRQELLARFSERLGAEHYGSERAETGVAKAEGIIAAELKRLGWSEETLQARPKGDAHWRLAIFLLGTAGLRFSAGYKSRAWAR